MMCDDTTATAVIMGLLIVCSFAALLLAMYWSKR